ncbi:MAG: hypothetical protein HZA17_04455 [Nitrospirae bacterium]|nr:hypothetical protein [Nitrospirota bacterium]
MHKQLVRAFLIICLAAFLTSCASSRSYVQKDQAPEPSAAAGPSVSQPDPLTRDGIFIQEGKTEILIKCKNRSLINIIDELFYKKRINYTLLTDISKYNLTICDDCGFGSDYHQTGQVRTEAEWADRKQKRFRNLSAFLDYVMNTINEEDQKGSPQKPCFPFLCRNSIKDQQPFLAAMFSGLEDEDSLTRHLRASFCRNESPADCEKSFFAGSLNELIRSESLFTVQTLENAALPDQVREIRERKSRDETDLMVMNRLIIESLMPQEIIPLRENCFPRFCSSSIRDPKTARARLLSSGPDLLTSEGKLLFNRKEREDMIKRLNPLIKSEMLYQGDFLSEGMLSNEVRDLILAVSTRPQAVGMPQLPQSGADSRLNRAVLDDLFQDTFRRGRKMGYQYTGDGVEFYEHAEMLPRPDYFKKIFLYNLTADDAASHLSTAFSLTQTQSMPVPGQMPYPVPDPMMQQQMAGGKKDGIIVKLPSQNALLVKASREMLDRISQIFFSLDASASLVLVETQVFEYDNSIERKIGNAIEYSKKSVEGNQENTFSLKTLFGEGITESTVPIIKLGLTKKTDTEIKYSLLNSLALFGRNGVVRISAEPRLVLKPGTTAEVKLNTVKYVITSGVNYSDIRPIETGVIMKIKPTILSENKIFLEMELEQSEFIPNLEKDIVQTTNKNIIKTSVIVNDGELISLGGINNKKSAIFKSGVPILKDIPILGYIFGSEAVTNNDIRIEFMIRPTIKDYRSKNAGIVAEILEKDEEVKSKIR